MAAMVLQWMLAALFQCFIASFLLAQCSGLKKKNNKKAPLEGAKKPAPILPNKAKPVNPPAQVEKAQVTSKKADPLKTTAPQEESKLKEEVKPVEEVKPKEEASLDETAKSKEGGSLGQEEEKPVSSPSVRLEKTQVVSEKSALAKSRSGHEEGSLAEVKITPDKLRFKPGDEAATFEIENLTDQRLAIKFKCSDNQIYTFKPVFFILSPKEKSDRVIKRAEDAPVKPDKLMVVYTDAGNAVDAKKLYESRPRAKELIVGLVMA